MQDSFDEEKLQGFVKCLCSLLTNSEMVKERTSWEVHEIIIAACHPDAESIKLINAVTKLVVPKSKNVKEVHIEEKFKDEQAILNAIDQHIEPC